MKRVIVIVLFLMFASVWSSAHGPIHEKIERVSKAIAKDPNNAELYIERSSYYKIDRDRDRAMADLLVARRLDPEILTIDFLAAELCYEFESYHTALAYITTFEARAFSLGETYLLKSKILDKLFLSDSALYYIHLAYSHQTVYTTHFFVLASQFALYADKENYEDAKAWLLKGRQHLPYDIVLQEERIELALRFKNYQDAEAVCLEELPKLKRKEKWYYKLATIYWLQGKKQDALQYAEKAEAAVNDLPQHLSATDYVSNLSKDIQLLLTEIKNNE